MLAGGLPPLAGDDLRVLIAGIFPRKAAGVDQVEPDLGQPLMETPVVARCPSPKGDRWSRPGFRSVGAVRRGSEAPSRRRAYSCQTNGLRDLTIAPIPLVTITLAWAPVYVASAAFMTLPFPTASRAAMLSASG